MWDLVSDVTRDREPTAPRPSRPSGSRAPTGPAGRSEVPGPCEAGTASGRPTGRPAPSRNASPGRSFAFGVGSAGQDAPSNVWRYEDREAGRQRVRRDRIVHPDPQHRAADLLGHVGVVPGQGEPQGHARRRLERIRAEVEKPPGVDQGPERPSFAVVKLLDRPARAGAQQGATSPRPRFSWAWTICSDIWVAVLGALDGPEDADRASARRPLGQAGQREGQARVVAAPRRGRAGRRAGLGHRRRSRGRRRTAAPPRARSPRRRTRIGSSCTSGMSMSGGRLGW